MGVRVFFFALGVAKPSPLPATPSPKTPNPQLKVAAPGTVERGKGPLLCPGRRCHLVPRHDASETLNPKKS